MKIHPIAEVFPNPSRKDATELYNSIAKHGLLEPLLVNKKHELLDGRNRLSCCGKLGIKIRKTVFQGTDEEALDYVVAKNLARRHLTTANKALVAGRLADLRRGENRQNGGSTQNTVKNAADQTGVSERSAERGKAVIDGAVPEVVDAVESGRVSLADGAAISALPPDEQETIVAADDPKEELKKKSPPPAPKITGLDPKNPSALVAWLHKKLSTKAIGQRDVVGFRIAIEEYIDRGFELEE